MSSIEFNLFSRDTHKKERIIQPLSDDEVKKNNKGNLLFFQALFSPPQLALMLRYRRIVVNGIVQVLLMN